MSEITSLWNAGTAKEFSLSCFIVFLRYGLMRFKVLNDLSASTEEIGVVKMMSKNCEVAVNVAARR